jgi:hypothetical protein
MAIVCLVTSEKDTLRKKHLAYDIEKALLTGVPPKEWFGTPKRNSYYYYPWEVVELVTNSTKTIDNEENNHVGSASDFTSTTAASSTSSVLPIDPTQEINRYNTNDSISTSSDRTAELSSAEKKVKSFAHVIRTRRSALRYTDFANNRNGAVATVQKMTQADFYSILCTTVPSLNGPYWNPISAWGVNVHLCIYVIHVEGILFISQFCEFRFFFLLLYFFWLFNLVHFLIVRIAIRLLCSLSKRR